MIVLGGKLECVMCRHDHVVKRTTVCPCYMDMFDCAEECGCTGEDFEGEEGHTLTCKCVKCAAGADL